MPRHFRNITKIVWLREVRMGRSGELHPSGRAQHLGPTGDSKHR